MYPYNILINIPGVGHQNLIEDKVKFLSVPVDDWLLQTLRKNFS